MTESLITIAETGEFIRRGKHLINDEERQTLVIYLAEHPEAGALIENTGGIRKLRWARGGKGKSQPFPRGKKATSPPGRSAEGSQRRLGENMSELFESIKQGLEEAIAHSKGEICEVRVFSPQEVNVKDVRRKTGLTQNQFAATFGISVATLRHWERGDRKPHGPALVLLNAADNDPAGLLQILNRCDRMKERDRGRLENTSGA
jgi:putative transcriptional regulator